MKETERERESGGGGKRENARWEAIPHLCQQPIDKYWLFLSIAVCSKNSLEIVGRIPASIKNDHTVCSNQVDSE